MCVDCIVLDSNCQVLKSIWHNNCCIIHLVSYSLDTQGIFTKDLWPPPLRHYSQIAFGIIYLKAVLAEYCEYCSVCFIVLLFRDTENEVQECKAHAAHDFIIVEEIHIWHLISWWTRCKDSSRNITALLFLCYQFHPSLAQTSILINRAVDKCAVISRVSLYFPALSHITPNFPFIMPG